MAEIKKHSLDGSNEEAVEKMKQLIKDFENEKTKSIKISKHLDRTGALLFRKEREMDKINNIVLDGGTVEERISEMKKLFGLSEEQSFQDLDVDEEVSD